MNNKNKILQLHNKPTLKWNSEIMAILLKF